MSRDDVPPIAWQTDCQLIPFPLTAQVGRVRNVALKLFEKPTERSAAYYRGQTEEALLARLERFGVPEEERAVAIAGFWRMVEKELVRLSYAQPRQDHAQPPVS